MDPISAISLFGNVITIVDAGVKSVKSLKELYDSSTGFSRTDQRLRAEVSHLEAIVQSLSASQIELASCPQQPLLRKVAEECTEACTQIRVVLDKCKVNSQGPKAVAVLKAWAKSQSQKSEIRELQVELELCRERLRTAVAAATRFVLLLFDRP